MSDSNPALRRRDPAAAALGAQSTASPSPPPSNLSPIIVFYALFVSHAFAAFYHPIQDCDEVFNYWEPTHYLNHGHGFQTWEYSPVYAIRSWAYAALHAILIQGSKVVPVVTEVFGKRAEFFMLRVTLALLCALCEARLFASISKTLNQRRAFLFVLVMATSPGMFHASISYLPSSFAMYTTMLSMAAFMDWRGGLRTAQGILFTGLGACLGWPFAVALAAPFLIEEAVLAASHKQQAVIDLAWRVLDGTARVLAILAAQVLFDGALYRKLTIVPLNIVFYNVISSTGGPDLYGTEPWHYYLRNLSLNFHIWFLLAVLSLPLVLLQIYSPSTGTLKASHLRGLFIISPFYLWLAIFTLQPHKEERFMYPAYPSLALNAATTFHILLTHLGATNPKSLIAKIPVQVRLFAILAFLTLTLALSAFRTIGTITAYAAPLQIYEPLHAPNVTSPGQTLCLGKEWYRFPSHHLLPSGLRAKFIKSEFTGLLPGDFATTAANHGSYAGTWRIPAGMNDLNEEDLGKYVGVGMCDWLVDSHLPSTVATELEPEFVNRAGEWERVLCLPFLDAASTGVAGRLGWVPDLPWVPESFRRVWGQYCLLKQAAPNSE